MNLTDGVGTPPAAGPAQRGRPKSVRYERLLDLQNRTVDWIRIPIEEVLANTPDSSRQLSPSELKGREQAKWHNAARPMRLRIVTYTAENGDIVVTRPGNRPGEASRDDS